jgi:hypothetical protein
MNRLLLVVRSMADKSIELSRGVVEARNYGNCNAKFDIDAVRGVCGCLNSNGWRPTLLTATRLFLALKVAVEGVIFGCG